MNWRFLFGELLKDEENGTSAGNGEIPTGGSVRQGTVTEQDETYQKKLLENDLYVWSLLLFKRDNV
jgi:hypothetical protein